MKILHTSDWHLGHVLYDYDRTEEQQAMLDQMVEIVKEEQPDVFILAGDVYHTGQPSASVQKMLTEAIVRLHDANPKMYIIVTAGNHDNGSKHDIFKTPWKALKVYTIGHFDKSHLEDYIITVPDVCHVIAFPHSYNLIPESVAEINKMVKERNTEDLPVIMTAHTTIMGSSFIGHDRKDEFTVGGIDAIEVSKFGDEYDYLALGHIHKPQDVDAGTHHVRYSGTPIPVSFDEAYEHSVTMVEINRHGDSLDGKIREIPIANPRPLVTIPATGTKTLEEAKVLLTKFLEEEHKPSYIRLNVEVDDRLPSGTESEIIKMIEDAGDIHRFCHINTPKKEKVRGEASTLTVQEFNEKEPIEIARLYAQFKGETFDKDMELMFKEAENYLEKKED